MLIPHNVSALCPLQAPLEVMDEETSQLWWAGKELVRGKKLLDYIGKYEKTELLPSYERQVTYKLL